MRALLFFVAAAIAGPLDHGQSPARAPVPRGKLFLLPTSAN